MSGPERIWAYTMFSSQIVASHTSIHFPQWAEAHEYILRDLATTEAAALRAEIERLREALDRIDTASNHYAMTPTYSEGVLRYAHQSTRNLARAALKGGDV